MLPDASIAVQITIVLPAGKTLPDEGWQMLVAPGQLSLTTGANVTWAEQAPGAVGTTSAVGHCSTGASPSITETWNWHCATLPDASCAAHVTIVTPRLKTLPLAGEHATVAPEQLSLTMAAKVTTLPQFPGLAATLIEAGQATTGDSVSTTVTVNAQWLVLPTASVATQLTVVTPRPKSRPGGGRHSTPAPGQLSVTTGVKL
jgi:hypothetical protein